ncbi:MAG: hypothetical protein AB7I41_00485 [Candidatus Sericytochromatia bacterium]
MRRMIKTCLGAFLVLGVTLPSAWAQTRDIRNLKNRLEKAQDSPKQRLMAQAEQPVCKGDRKPVCYTEALVASKGWALLRIARPEDNLLYFVLLRKMPDETWKIVLYGDHAKLSVDHFKVQNARMPDDLAKKMIAELKTR